MSSRNFGRSTDLHSHLTPCYPCTSQIVPSSSLLLVLLLPDITLGEGIATSIWCATDEHCLEPLKPPNISTEDLGEGGGVWSPSNPPWIPGDPGGSEDLNSLRPASVIANSKAKVREPAHVEVQESGGVLLSYEHCTCPHQGHCQH